MLQLKNQFSFIGDIRGKGLMLGVEFVEDAATKNHKEVLYTIKNLNHSTVEAIIEIFQDKYETEDITVNLIIVNREDYPKKGVLSLFKSVKFIDNL